ncbi:GNAT family N-acetyltransferase [Alienimonas californiensis]|uniref:N-acetyltransferase domain-containing protein n=1 Tax=Alienimonas californiensis TaxID=2527989 RepID=A0A517P4B2_9PLAN|nr:GNAT family N-acetyltransferase [Alienimonas californiensis]QDT14232.1 hypothetical protein CA12_03010 [Alienimonas californiensis]
MSDDTNEPFPWKIRPFKKADHDRSAFDCGVPSLNDWLKNKMSQWEKKGFSRTLVLVKDGERAVRGYYALSPHTVLHEALTEDQGKGLPMVDVPVVLIGRLAVDQTLQGQAFGRDLLLHALRRIYRLSLAMGVRAVEVDAIDDSAVRFYRAYGFEPLADQPRKLYLPIPVVRTLFESGAKPRSPRRSAVP